MDYERIISPQPCEPFFLPPSSPWNDSIYTPLTSQKESIQTRIWNFWLRPENYADVPIDAAYEMYMEGLIHVSRFSFHTRRHPDTPDNLEFLCESVARKEFDSSLISQKTEIEEMRENYNWFLFLEYCVMSQTSEEFEMEEKKHQIMMEQYENTLKTMNMVGSNIVDWLSEKQKLMRIDPEEALTMNPPEEWKIYENYNENYKKRFKEEYILGYSNRTIFENQKEEDAHMYASQHSKQLISSLMAKSNRNARYNNKRKTRAAEKRDFERERKNINTAPKSSEITTPEDSLIQKTEFNKKHTFSNIINAFFENKENENQHNITTTPKISVQACPKYFLLEAIDGICEKSQKMESETSDATTVHKATVGNTYWNKIHDNINTTPIIPKGGFRNEEGLRKIMMKRRGDECRKLNNFFTTPKTRTMKYNKTTEELLNELIEMDKTPQSFQSSKVEKMEPISEYLLSRGRFPFMRY